MKNKFNLSIPKEENEDFLLETVKSLLALVPAVLINDGNYFSISSAIASILAGIIQPSIEKRREIWRENVVIALDHLIKKTDQLDLKKLSKNDEFISIFISLTEEAMKTHQQEKIHLLRNVLINSFSTDIDFDFKHILIRTIGELTQTQILILKLIKENENTIKNIDTFKGYYNNIDVGNLKLEYEEFKYYLIDLKNKGLLNISSSVMNSDIDVRESISLMGNNMSNEGESFMKISKTGKALLIFISDNG